MFGNYIIKPSLFDGVLISTYVVCVDGEDYIECEKSCKHMWCSSKPGTYGKGLINTKNDPYKVERIGYLGETAFGYIIDKKPDLNYKKYGSDHDFVINNLKIDVKTASYNYNCGLIRVVNDLGMVIELSSDIYVFGYLSSENTDKKIAEINMVGYQTKEHICTLPIIPGRKQGSIHKNHEVYYSTLKSIENLNRS